MRGGSGGITIAPTIQIHRSRQHRRGEARLMAKQTTAEIERLVDQRIIQARRVRGLLK